ncbi:hypothetical protein AM587_10003718 [Phytophthora nicotianae]|uniref:Uncharacterized protein n=1 Tax=Phytophthora nicotianae TaxID=4792 RepID=A0A0W8CLM5_PHYNI|nr:hypothetical protein AM587_10003718 [Phytophthora nicotianae]
MRAHKGFYNWITTLSPPAVSPRGKLFATEELNGAHDRVTTERWLRDRQGKSLREKWLGLSQSQRDRHLQDVEDPGFNLDDYPQGIQDSRSDPSCYPYRGRSADTPTVLQDAVPIRTAQPSSQARTDRAFGQFNQLHDELTSAVINSALTAELTAMAMAVRENNSQLVAFRAAAVVDCLGGLVGSAVGAESRRKLLSIIHDVSDSMGATRLLLHNGLHTDSEAKETATVTNAAVVEANTALKEFTTNAKKSNSHFRLAYQERQIVRPTATRYLNEFAWINMDGFDDLEGQINEVASRDGNQSDCSLGVESGGSTVIQTRENVDEDPREVDGSADVFISSDGEADDSGKRGGSSAADTVRSKPRACVRKRARTHYYFG